MPPAFSDSSTPRRHRRRRSYALLVLPPTLVALAAVPASSGGAHSTPAPRILDHLSSGVMQRYLAAHPEQAQNGAKRLDTGEALANARASSASAVHTPKGLVRFNQDFFGLPQNEESVSGCATNPKIVLSGTNDYRGLLNAKGNFTGWHLSTNGGRSLTNEGLLPTVDIAGNQVPSGGDPVDVVAANCNLYAGSLNYDPVDPFGRRSGLGVYKSSVTRLANCPGGDDPSCWPTRRAVAQVAPPYFLDKEWMDVGNSGRAGRVVWTTYSRFTNDPAAPLGFTGATIFAVRCDGEVRNCTAPINISGPDQDVQFSDVTIGRDGRTYVTWAEIKGELEQTAQTFVFKMRVAQQGSTTFGPTRTIATENNVIPFSGVLHADSFRIATNPKNTVAMVNGRARTFLTWEGCRVRLLDTVCEEPQVKLRYSDDQGKTWSRTRFVSLSGDNYFPTIDTDPATGKIAVAYFTSRYDPVFHNRQDIELATVNPTNGVVTKRQRLTPVSNESESDPLLNSRFIGDYIEVHAQNGKAYVAFNANYTSIPLLGQGSPIPQQDNFLRVAGM